MCNLKNKKGVEVLSFFWFAVLVGVGTGISVGVLFFYSADVDVRKTEANYLYFKISDCLVQNGLLLDEVLDENFNIFEKCSLDSYTFSGENFYFYIQFFNESDLKLRNSLTSESGKIRKECEIVLNDEKIEAKYYPKCFDNKGGKINFFYFEKGEIKKGYMKILTASNNNGIKLAMVKI